MAQIHLHLSSFNAGELSPLLGNRFAVEKVGSGCRRLRNFLLHVHGPAFRRPGMEHMGATSGDSAKSRLFGFNFSTTTSAVIEFHPSGLQVWKDGALVELKSEVTLPYSEAECAELQIAQVNDVCYIAHPSHPPRQLVRYADNDWRLGEIVWKYPALGDENVRADEIATPTESELLNVETENWPEFTPGAGSYVFAIINPATGAIARRATLQQYVSGAWVIRQTIEWKGSTPGTKSGTFPAGGIFRVTYTGEQGGMTARVTRGGSVVEHELSLSVAQPASLASVEVPAGEYKVKVHSVSTVPSGAKIYLQKKVGSHWVDVQKLPLVAGTTTVYRGATLTAATFLRLDWRGVRAMDGDASIWSVAFPATNDVTLSAAATSGTGVALTASDSIFSAGQVGAYYQIAHRRASASVQIVSAQPTITGAESDVLRVAGKWEVFSYGTWQSTLCLQKKVGATWETVRSWDSHKDRNVIASGSEDSEVEMRLTIAAGTSEAATGAAVPRFVLEASDARVYGLVKITAVGTLDANGKTDTATVNVVVALHSTAATSLWTEGAWSSENGYPRSVATCGQRLWFGGTRTEPQRLWGSLVNDYTNFRRSSLDDASVSFTPAAQQSNPIQWMLGSGKDLIVGTAGGEFTVGSQGPIVTPTDVMIQPRSAYGSQYLPALMLGDVVVFSQRGGVKLRQVAPHTENVVWSASDLTVLAEHVTKSGIRQFAVMSFPYSILWAVSNDGKLLGMTFEQEQNVFGWHVHETSGEVESVAVIYGEVSDEVWLTVKRDGKRTVERLDPLVFARDFAAAASLIYLDSAVRVESETAFSTVTGLDRLEGKTVSVLGDGAELKPCVVASGTITLEKSVNTAIVGLPFTSELQPMRQEVPMRDGTAQGRNWRTSRIALLLHDSAGGEVGDSLQARFEKLNFRRVSTPMGSAPALYSGEIETAIESSARAGVDAVVKTSDPLPFNVGAIIIKGDVYGE